MLATCDMLWQVKRHEVGGTMHTIIASFFGPIYFGYRDIDYFVVVGWAIVVSIYWLFTQRNALAVSRAEAYGSGNRGGSLATFMIFVSVLTCTVGSHSLAYFIANSIFN
jgi:hypothetical protein